MSRISRTQIFDGQLRRLLLPLSWVVIIFAVVVVTVFAVSIDSGRSIWQSGWFAVFSAVLAVVGTVILETVVGSHGVRVAIHVLFGLFVLSLAFLLTALQFADRFMTVLDHVLLGGLWAVGLSLAIGGLSVYRGAGRQVRWIAKVGLVSSGILGLTVIGYVLRIIAVNGWTPGSVVTAEAIALWAFLIVLVGVPGLVFYWDMREGNLQRPTR